MSFAELTQARCDTIAELRACGEAGRFDCILAYYRALWPTMKATPPWQWATDPYEIDWTPWFSPIEAMLWGDIRNEAIVLYPQHPVAGYFVDFGHPVAKVALELDGAQWHQDKEKDRARQREIEAKGWTVYRLSGKDCYRSVRGHFDDEGEWVEGTSEAQILLQDIGRIHGVSQRQRQAA